MDRLDIHCPRLIFIHCRVDHGVGEGVIDIDDVIHRRVRRGVGGSVMGDDDVSHSLGFAMYSLYCSRKAQTRGSCSSFSNDCNPSITVDKREVRYTNRTIDNVLNECRMNSD